MASTLDLTMFDIPSTSDKEVTIDDLNDLIIAEADTIANYNVEGSTKAKDFLVTLHTAMQKNEEFINVLSEEALRAYFVTLEDISNLGFSELSERLWTKPSKSKKATAKKSLESQELALGEIKLSL